MEDAAFHFQFAPVFNGRTFHEFLQLLVGRYPERKIFMVIDNGPCHWLDDAGKKWLASNRDRLELFRLPAYSPEFNAIEGVWKKTRDMTTHNRFYPSELYRDAALHATFTQFQQDPSLIEGYVLRFRDIEASPPWMCLAGAREAMTQAISLTRNPRLRHFLETGHVEKSTARASPP